MLKESSFYTFYTFYNIHAVRTLNSRTNVAFLLLKKDFLFSIFATENVHRS